MLFRVPYLTQPIMKVPIEQYNRAYQLVKEDVAKFGSSVVVFVDYDCDAVCACKILTSLFQSDFISYNVVCVNGLEDLERGYQELVMNNSMLRAVVMLNCGGGINLDELFELEKLPKVTLYVLDSHRPYHPENVANKQQILLFDDGVVYDESEDVNEELMNTNAAYYGSTVAGLTYALASQLNKANNELLWYALVGLTDQFLHQKIDEERYINDVVHFKTEVLNRNIQDDEAATEQTADQHRILVSEEYKFFLYRHWNLYDSMYHSKYVAVRLGVWQSNGRRRLEMLLAKMGVPLEQCRMSYLTMNKTFKDQLHVKLTEHGKDFHLDQLTYPSFIKKQHCDMVVSAADTVWAVTALLDLPVHQNVNNDADLAAAASHYHEQLKRNFWVAYDALSSKNVKLLQQGIQQAIQLQQAIVRQVTTIIEKKDIVQSGPFRYCLLSESPELKYFVHPLALSKLAHFLLDTLIEMGKSKKVKPLLVGALNEHDRQHEGYLIVGLNGQHSAQPNVPNNFSSYFDKALKRTRSRATYHSFNTQTVQIHKDDIVKFIDYLRSGLVF